MCLVIMVLKDRLVTIKLQTKESEDIQLTALAFHTRCSPLPRAVNIHQYPSLQSLDLADCLTTNDTVSNRDSNVDVLIGSDFYWELVLGEVKRQENGLVAISSKFGWLASGPIRDVGVGSVVTNSNLVLQGPSTVPGTTDNEDKLENELRRFLGELSHSASLMSQLLKKAWKVFHHKSPLIFFSADIL